jgi:hypothetical protein
MIPYPFTIYPIKPTMDKAWWTRGLMGSRDEERSPTAVSEA